MKRTEALQEAIDATAPAGFVLPVRLRPAERRFAMALGHTEAWGVTARCSPSAERDRTQR